MIPGPLFRPSNTLGVIKIVMLLAVGVEFTGEDQVRNFAIAGRRKGVVALDTVDVAIEDAGVPGFTEED